MNRAAGLGAIAMLSALGIGCIAASFAGPKPAWIWNYTASAPLGLYQVLDRPWRKGDWVAVAPDPRVAAMLTQFGVSKPDRLLVKRVAAGEDDMVCRNRLVVKINGELAATAMEATSSGQRLPNWGGCRRLKKSEVFLLGEADASFDGRYWGVSEAVRIVGPVRRVSSGGAD